MNDGKLELDVENEKNIPETNVGEKKIDIVI